MTAVTINFKPAMIRSKQKSPEKMQNIKNHLKLAQSIVSLIKIMKRTLTLLSIVLLLVGCSSAAPNTINITIDDKQITIEQGSLKTDEVTITLHNQSQKTQTIKVQGLQINYVSQPLVAQTSQELHFSLQQQRGNLIVSSTDTDNQVLTTTISIH
ncbi:hypothetical protein KBB08_01900 [Candidatus Gracilibacteria bacterium]|nr:hypothetical protein [Candidatus Gracilibacteria bacterium]